MGSASSDSNKYHLDLSGIMLYITATSHDPLSGARPLIIIISNILHCVFIPMYAAELGVDPQANFVNQPDSQGLLGSTVLCHPSGASRVLDRYTP